MMSSELNVKDVCEIIAACATNGVSMLKYGTLEVQFKESRTPCKEKIEDQHIELTSQGPEKEVPPMSPEVLQKIEQDMKQAELEQMLINDPAQFEELISAGEIDNEEDRGTESTLP
jgi:restriction endonuclease Mrr